MFQFLLTCVSALEVRVLLTKAIVDSTIFCFVSLDGLSIFKNDDADEDIRVRPADFGELLAELDRDKDSTAPAFWSSKLANIILYSVNWSSIKKF